MCHQIFFAKQCNYTLASTKGWKTNRQPIMMKFSNQCIPTWKTSKKGKEQLEHNIAHPNIVFYVVISACMFGLLFFCFKIFCTSTHSHKPLIQNERVDQQAKIYGTNRNKSRQFGYRNGDPNECFKCNTCSGGAHQTYANTS